ncbi:MAG TPA: glycosyl hydrolase, partial [Clostridia bacterium]
MEDVSLFDSIPGCNWKEFRPLVFFGIKTDVSRESIRNWVKWCKQQGFGGFNMIVDTECRGRANDEWINMLMESYETALKAAEEEGLAVWLFDDWGYPSGTAGGLVCTDDSLRLKKLVISHDCKLERGEQIFLTVPDNIVTAGIISNGTFSRIELKRGEVFGYAAKADTERFIIVSWEFDEQKAKSLCKSYPGDPAMSLIDMLNPKAAEKFLKVMHERYYNRFSNYFGTVIKGFFYDEPYLSFGFPWTENLPAEFWRKKGYDLLDVIPVMMINVQNCDSKELKTYMDDYFDVWTAMAAENFYGILARWCESRGVELSGHADLDHHLNTLSTVSGHFYRNMKHNTRPAVDVIWAQIEPGVFTDFPRYAGSVKRLLGRSHAVSETFAGMGQGLYGDLMRYITDHQTVRGIDDFHLMISTNDSAVNGSESPQMPNHMLQEPFGRIIYERIARAGAIAQSGVSAASTALYIPSCDIYRAQLCLSRITINNAEKLPWEWVDDIARELVYMPCDFDYIWDEAILELELTKGGFMTKSGHIIKTIILPPDCTLTNYAAGKLRQFNKNGGKIISVFRPNRLLEKEALLLSDPVELKAHVHRTLEIIGADRISICTRIENNRIIYMLLNESTKKTNAEIIINEKGSLYEISLTDGKPSLISSGSSFRFSTEFEESMLKVFVVDKEFVKLKPGSAVNKEKQILPFNWSLILPDKKTVSINGIEWPEWSDLGYPEYSGSMKYKAEFDWNFAEDSAVISVPGLYRHAIVSVDGREAGRLAFRPYELSIGSLKAGRHQIEITVYNT